MKINKICLLPTKNRPIFKLLVPNLVAKPYVSSTVLFPFPIHTSFSNYNDKVFFYLS